MRYCAAPGCSSYTDSPSPAYWLYVYEQTGLDAKPKSFCCWQCLAHYAYDQRPVL
jgi:hypothetical protein